MEVSRLSRLRPSSRATVAVGAIAIIAIFMIVLTCMGIAIMESNRYSQSAKFANEAVASKALESLAVVQVSSAIVNVTNMGPAPAVVVGFYRVNPADNNPSYVPLSNPATVPLLSSVSITLPQTTPESWMVGVVTSLGNVFWEGEPIQGGTETVPTGEPVYVTFLAQGMGSDASGTILTVDGVGYSYSQLPKTFQWVSGSTHSFSWSSPVSGSSGVRYVWVSTSGLSTKQSDGSFTVNANGYIIAAYRTQYSLTMQASPSGGGTTNPAPGTYWYDSGSTVSISASAASGYAFDRWVGSGSGSYTGTSSSATVTVNAPITETAYFFTFPISVSPTSGSTPIGGSVSATVTVTYVSGYGSKTISLSASGLPSGASVSFSPSSVTISPSSTTATSTMTITTSTSTPAGTYTITVAGTGGGLTKTATYTLTVQNVAVVTFSATGLSSDASGVVLVVDGSSYYYGDLPKTFSWAIGSTHTFEWKTPIASSTSGKQYAWVSTSGLSTARSGSINVPSSGGSVAATYKTQYYLTMQVSPSGAGSVSPGSGWYDAGSSVQISATASSGYAFTVWTASGSGSYAGTANPASVTMNGPIVETANFVPWLTGWSYRLPITVTSTLSLSNYQILVQVNTASLVSAGKMRSDCGDVRFTDSDGATLLSYWIEPATVNTASTQIWVKVPSIPAGTKTIYMYYGNPSATSQSSSVSVFGKSLSGRFTSGDYDAYYDAFILSSREWISGGTSLGISGDDSGKSVTLPFAATVYGTSVSQAYLSTNGLFRWDNVADNSYSNSLNKYKKVLTAHWDDLYISTSYRSDAGVFQITGTDSNLGQYVAYRWATTYYASRGTPADFEIVIYRNGYIQFNVYRLWSSATPTEYICRGDGSNCIDLTPVWSLKQSVLFVPRSVPEPSVSAGSEEVPSSVRLYEHYNAGDDGYASAYASRWLAQSFTVGSAPHTARQVKLKLWRTGTPGTLVVSIRATDANGYPAGPDLTVGTLDGNTLTTSSSGAWYTVTFSQEITLSANTRYAIVVRAPDAPSGSYVGWRLDSTSPTYAGGTYLTSGDGGASWSAPYNYDLMFEVWGR